MFNNFFSCFFIKWNIMALYITTNFFKVIIKINIIWLIWLIILFINILFGLYRNKSSLGLDLKLFEIKIASTNFTDSLLKILLTPLINKNLLFLIKSNNKILLKLFKKLLSFKFWIHFFYLWIFGSIQC